ncbi:NADP-dependent succinate-semialdehyde dehydrogenase [Methylothermus subterraneus]
MNLNDPSLLRSRCYVGGHWVSAASGKFFPVVNPASGEEIARVPALAADEARQAIEAAASALPVWQKRTAEERAEFLKRWHRQILENREDLARIVTLENGKPFAEALGEVDYGAGFVDWFAGEALRAYGETIPSPWPGRRILTFKQPVGVCAAITPWNFPLAMLTRKCAAALAAGCTAVAKPAAETPLTALALAELAERAGIPAGVVNVITGPAEVLGTELATHPKVRKLSFTGSTRVGRLLMAQAAPTLKRLSLELGGNAPFLVFADADLKAALSGAMLAKFRNGGQSCVAANRFLVQKEVYEEFAAELAQRIAALKVGPGFEAGVQVGPLIHAKAVAKIEALIAEAVAQGAQVVTGGGRHLLGGNFFQPTLLKDVSPRMRIFAEEIFGPVAILTAFTDDEEAIALANASEYGLAAYFYTQDLKRALRVAEALECGMVGVNVGRVSTPVAPFGGIKQSGFGREGSKYGLEEYLEIKYLCLGVGEE